MAVKRVEADGVVAVWGDAAQAKAELRRESIRRHQALPAGERLKAALSLVQVRPGRHERKSD